MYCFKSALIVDDQKTTAMVISEVLKRLGFVDVAAAGDGGEALSMLAQRRYDLIVSDLHMQGMGGLELLRQIRSHERFRSLPFIMISADREPDEVARVEQAGADAFLPKPFGAPALCQKMSLVCASRGGDCSGRGDLGPG